MRQKKKNEVHTWGTHVILQPIYAHHWHCRHWIPHTVARTLRHVYIPLLHKFRSFNRQRTSRVTEHIKLSTSVHQEPKCDVFCRIKKIREHGRIWKKSPNSCGWSSTQNLDCHSGQESNRIEAVETSIKRLLWTLQFTFPSAEASSKTVGKQRVSRSDQVTCGEVSVRMEI
jgi:hypothetical protein